MHLQLSKEWLQAGLRSVSCNFSISIVWLFFKLYRLDNHVETSLSFPFGRIYFVVLVMRKGGENSGPWHLVCTLEVFHVHSYQDQFIQPSWAECFFVYLARFVLCVFIIHAEHVVHRHGYCFHFGCMFVCMLAL